MSTFKAITLDLQNDVTGTYDQTKTTIAGNVSQYYSNSYPVLAPPPVKWMDVFTDTGGDIANQMCYTANGRLFTITAITAGLARVILYNFSATTGVATYIGKVVLTFPNLAATTHTLRGFMVDDTNVSDIKIFVASTGSVTINGGLFMANGLVLADFTPIGFPTIPFATGASQKAVYFLQDPANKGAGQLNIASAGVLLDRPNSKAYVHNGVAATHQYYVYDYSAAPDVPGATFTVTIASPGVVTSVAHGYAAGDQVVFSTTGALPTGIVAGTTYFVSATGLTADNFQFSATSGGASINTTGTQSGVHTVRRAFGIATTNFSLKTGNLPALSGTLILLNSEKIATPAHTTNAGSDCAFFATTSNLYLGKLSDLTSGVVIWPSLVTSNLLGSTNQIVAPSALLADWSDFSDTAVFTTSTTKIISKQLVNNVIQSIFGILNNDYLEGTVTTGSTTFTQFGAITITDMDTSNNWKFLVGSTAGQRGIIASNGSSDYSLPNAYIISKVTTLPVPGIAFGLASANQYAQFTTAPVVYYRTSGFGTATGGWIQLGTNNLFPPSTSISQIQFKYTFDYNNPLISNPVQLTEGYFAIVSNNAISDNWQGSVDNTTQNGASPSYSAFRIISAYSTGTVPTMYFRAYDDSANLVASADTSADPASFEYSTNNGTSWNPLGTVPNTALTTELRYIWATPPGVKVSVSLRES